MSDQAPTVFGGRYELHRHIARGGMADVYLARDQLLDRWVAVKVLFAEFAADPTFVERFRREAQAAAKLNHPNIVAIYDWGEENGTYFIVMEYIEGLSLSQIIKQEGRLSAERSAEIAIEVATGLGYAHQKGYVHLDAKSANVLLSRKGEIKLGDFGIAKAIAGSVESSLTQTGAVMGTATYFSPEQAQGREVGPRSDLYSLGVVLYEMLVGRPPFTGDTPVSIAYKHVQEAPPAPSEFGVDVPSPLAAITRKLLAKNPENRYLSAEDLVSDLRRFRSGEQIAPTTTAPGPTTAQPTTALPAAAAPTGGSLGGAPPVFGPDGPQQAPVGASPMDATTAMPATVVPDQTQAAPTYYEPPADRRGSGAIIMAFIFGIAMLVAVGVLAFIFLRPNADGDVTGETVRVESVFGTNQDEAVRTLENLGLVVQVVAETNEERPVGIVLSQEPGGGTNVEPGSTVVLTVSAGIEQVLVPQVVGIQRASGEGLITSEGLRVRVEEVTSDSVPSGQIISQTPLNGERVDPASEVVIQVSVGPPDLQIPDVQSFSQQQAITLLEQAGFRVSVRGTFSNEIDEGLVAGTQPTANTPWPKGETVEILVSEGPEKLLMPSVLGLTPEDAQAMLQGVPFGFNMTPTLELLGTLDPAQNGVILEQIPLPNAEVDREVVIVLQIGVFLEPTPVPTALPTAIPTAIPTAVPTIAPQPTQPPAATAVPQQATCTMPDGTVVIDDLTTAECP